jgi:peptide chain release factor 1
LKLEWFSGTGCGGSNRNKKQNSCRLTHVPTNTVVTAQTRDRTNSERLARKELESRVVDQMRNRHNASQSSLRKDQVGSGMRGDKIRTIRFQDNTVIDHISGKKMQADKYMKGFLDQIWD